MGRQIIGYGHVDYTYASGRKASWFTLGLAANKDSISVYAWGVTQEGCLIDQYKDRLGSAVLGKSCLRFKKLADINLPVLQQLMDQAVKLAKA